ncbi:MULTISPECIES: helix-turn-helix domain-containing protein [Bacillus cereus group]|uniref:helix-turn-helix domain-containing protein n=1 Tax=Bacillus cereus group TaxID=86661 RepID=UPI000BECB902|nr:MULTISPECIES: helix-turn-helix domain-containing protein [Bacillus cereus group]MBJ8030706.1 DNA-binding protein [Bacillus cereus group sp. N21]PDY47462.1 hypothetical protein CON79_09390 [Bacillus pseudomycoides]
MKVIDNYMTPSEAAFYWGISDSTLRNKLQEGFSQKADKEREMMIQQGLIKCFIKPNGKRKEWIITTEAMIKWFGEQQK